MSKLHDFGYRGSFTGAQTQSDVLVPPVGPWPGEHLEHAVRSELTTDGSGQASQA